MTFGHKDDPREHDSAHASHLAGSDTSQAHAPATGARASADAPDGTGDAPGAPSGAEEQKTTRLPVISGIMAGQTPGELIAEARGAEADGAQGITVELKDLKPEFRNCDSLKGVIDSVSLPFMFCFYRNDMWKDSGDE